MYKNINLFGPGTSREVPGQNNFVHLCIEKLSNDEPYLLGFPAGLFRPGMSREGPGTGRDRTGPRDLEGPVDPWSRD